MKAHIIYAHPNDKSFNSSIFKKVKKSLDDSNISYSTSDLYAMNFNPVLNIADRDGRSKDILIEQQKVNNADWIITIYPVWWTQMPAILKGYIDRVFAYNFAFQLNEKGLPIKLLKGKKGIVISTFSHPLEYYKEEGYLSAFEKTIDEGIFNYVGIEVEKHFHFGAVVKKSNQEREGDLRTIYKSLLGIFN